MAVSLFKKLVWSHIFFWWKIEIPLKWFVNPQGSYPHTSYFYSNEWLISSRWYRQFFVRCYLLQWMVNLFKMIEIIFYEVLTASRFVTLFRWKTLIKEETETHSWFMTRIVGKFVTLSEWKEVQEHIIFGKEEVKKKLRNILSSVKEEVKTHFRENLLSSVKVGISIIHL